MVCIVVVHCVLMPVTFFVRILSQYRYSGPHRYVLIAKPEKLKWSTQIRNFALIFYKLLERWLRQCRHHGCENFIWYSAYRKSPHNRDRYRVSFYYWFKNKTVIRTDTDYGVTYSNSFKRSALRSDPNKVQSIHSKNLLN